MGPLTGKFGIGLELDRQLRPDAAEPSQRRHVVELEVDPETGAVSVDRYYVVDDLGRILNPMIVRGQQMGGVVQGIGQALMEHQVYDRSSGQLLTGSFMDYAMPHAAVMPNVECALEEVPCKTNPLGVKGIGESGTIGAPPTIINAVIDALRPLGVDADRHAGDAAAGLGDDPAREGERRRRVGSTRCSLRPRPEERSEGSRLEGWAACGAYPSRRTRFASAPQGEGRERGQSRIDFAAQPLPRSELE